jgi:protein-disulfide isomerase
MVRSGDHVSFPVGPGDPALGPPGAPVTMIELSDYECPFCRRAEGMVRQILSTYKGQIRLIHKDFPLDIHSRAIPAAEAARCAGEQNRFWEMRRALMSPDNLLTDESLDQARAALGLAKAPFDGCLASKKYEPSVRASVKQALDLGFHTTPSFIVNGRVVVGVAPAELRQAIEAALGHTHP